VLPRPLRGGPGSDALVIITGWPEFKDLDFDLIKSIMKRPVLIDTQNMLDDGPMAARAFSISALAGDGRSGAVQ